MGTRIKLLLVVAALALLVVVSATAAPAGAVPKKKHEGDKEDACAIIWLQHSDALPEWCPLQG